MIAKTASRRTIAGLLLLAMGMLVASASQPPLTGGEFTVNRSTMDAGGGTVSGGLFILRGTIGQYDTNQVGHLDYSLRGGFWTYPDSLFRDGFESNEGAVVTTSHRSAGADRATTRHFLATRAASAADGW